MGQCRMEQTADVEPSARQRVEVVCQQWKVQVGAYVFGEPLGPCLLALPGCGGAESAVEVVLVAPGVDGLLVWPGGAGVVIANVIGGAPHRDVTAQVLVFGLDEWPSPFRCG